MRKLGADRDSEFESGYLTYWVNNFVYSTVSPVDIMRLTCPSANAHSQLHKTENIKISLNINVSVKSKRSPGSYQESRTVGPAGKSRCNTKIQTEFIYTV